MTPEEFYYWNQQFGGERDEEMDNWFAEEPPKKEKDVHHWCIKRDEWIEGHTRDCIVCRTMEYTEVRSVEAMNPEYTSDDKAWLATYGITIDES